MSRNLLNLSGKIDKLTIELFEDISKVAKSMNIDFFVVGATARDIILTYGYEIKTIRATNDIDLAVQVVNWEQYENLKKALITDEKFTITRELQRLEYDGRLLIDILPFGVIADKDGSFFWPPEHEVKMNLLGFKEAYENAINIKLRERPVLYIKFASLPGLAIMKLISWDDKYPERGRDAKDLGFIMRNYLDAGNDKRLFDGEIDIIDRLNETGDVDYQKAGVRLLGRDMANIAGAETKKKIIEILMRETRDKNRYRLVENMMDNYSGSSENFEEYIELLEQMKLGVLETGYPRFS